MNIANLFCPSFFKDWTFRLQCLPFPSETSLVWEYMWLCFNNAYNIITTYGTLHALNFILIYKLKHVCKYWCVYICRRTDFLNVLKTHCYQENQMRHIRDERNNSKFDFVYLPMDFKWVTFNFYYTEIN